MKAVTSPRFIHQAAIVLYVVLPILGWWLFGWWGALLGLLIALVFDNIWPSWQIELQWNNIEAVLHGLLQHGAIGQRLWLRIKDRNLIVVKGTVDEKMRLFIQIPTGQWRHFVDELEGDSKLREECLYTYYEPWKDKQYYWLVPDEPVSGTFALIKRSMDHVGTDINTDVMAYINGHHRKLWGLNKKPGNKNQNQSNQDKV